MAVDLTLLNSNSLDNIETNFERVKNALQETLGRNGNLPNHMNVDLDMNSNDILNVNSIDTEVLYINGNPVVPDTLGSLPANSVGSLQIVDGSVGPDKLEEDYYTKIESNSGFNSIVSARVALKALDTSSFDNVYLTEVGREGQFVFRSGDYSAQVTADTAEAIYIKADDTATTSGAWVRVFDGGASVLWFGALSSGAGSGSVSANNAALAAAKAWQSIEIAAGRNPRIVFPAGIYDFSVFPDFAAPYAEIVSEGEVHLRYHGTEDAVVLGTTTTSNRHVTFGPFLVEAPSTAKNGFVVQGCHFSKVMVNVRGAGTTYAGIVTKFCVCTEFWLACSVNDGWWYLGAKPAKGIVLDQRAASHETSYCTFYNVCAEGLDLGLVLENALGNVFLGGTSEAIASTAIQIKANSRRNRFYGLDCEANSLIDVYCLGWENEFIGMDCEKQTTFDGSAYGNKIIGGNHRYITYGTSTHDNYAGGGVRTNHSSGGGISDSSTNKSNRFGDTYDVLNNKWGKGPRSTSVITVGTSPFTYTNTSSNDVLVRIAGGTVSTLTLRYDGSSSGVDVTNGIFPLRPGDSLDVGYTVAPSMSLIRG